MAIYFPVERTSGIAMRTRFELFFAVCVPSLLILGGCGTSRPASQGTYYLIATNIKIPYWQSALAGLNQAASELNVKASLVGPDTYQPLSQHEEFQRALSQDPAGILISVGDRRLMRADIDTAIDRGVPVFTIDSDAEFSKRLVFVGTDNVRAGNMIGTTVATTLSGKGNIVVFTMPDQLNLVQRMEGFNDALTGHPQLKVTRVVDMKGDPKVAFDTTTDILKKSADQVNAFVCLEALACAQVADVLSKQQAGGKLVVAMDAEPMTLDWIKKGFISATIAQKPYSMAYVALHMMSELNQRKFPSLDQNWSSSPVSPLPALVDTGVTLVNQDNVDNYIKESQAAH